MPTQDKEERPKRDRASRGTRDRNVRAENARKRGGDQSRSPGEQSGGGPPGTEEEFEVLYATRESLETGGIRIVQVGVRAAQAVEVLSQGELARRIQAGSRFYVLREGRKAYLGLSINARGLIELSADAATQDSVSRLPPCGSVSKGRVEYQAEHLTRRKLEGGRSRISRCSVRIGESVHHLGEQELIRHLRSGGRLYLLKNRSKSYVNLAVADEGFVFIEEAALAESAEFFDEEEPAPEPESPGSPPPPELKEPPPVPTDRLARLRTWGVTTWLAALSLAVLFLLFRSCATVAAPCPCVTPIPTTLTAPPPTIPPGATTPLTAPTTPAPGPTTPVPPGPTTPPPPAGPTTPPPPGPTTPAPGPTTPPPPPITPPSVTQLTIAHPKGMVSDPSTNRLFVGALGANSVVVLDERSITATNGAVSSAAVIATVKNITVPFGMGVLNSKVYVAENGSDSVGVIDAQDPTKPAETINIANGTNCRSASETHGPSHLAVNPVTNRIYVTLHDGTSQVAIVDADSRAVNCIDANAGAFGVAANSKSNHFYVGDRDAFDLRVYYDPQKNQPPVFQTTIPVMAWTDPYAQDSPRVPASPFYMAVSPDGTQLYVAVATNCKNRATPQHNCDLVDQILVYGINGQGELSATPKIQLPIGGNTYDGGWILQSVCAPNRLYVAETNDGPDAAIRGVTTFNGDLQPDQVSAPALESTDGGEPFSLAENPGLGRIYAGYKYYNDNSKGRLSFVSETACR